MKKILFMPVGFFEYDRIIEEEMKKMNYDVTVFSPMASYGNVFQKTMNVLSSGKYVKSRTKRLQKQFYNECKEEYDYVFAIVGRDIDVELFCEFKKKQKKAKFILYIWDDVYMMKHFQAIRPLFDEIYSFSSEDAKKYGFHFLPLFYTQLHEYKNQEKRYLLNMIGSSHSGRLDLWNTIIDKYNIPQEKSFLYLMAVNVSSLRKGRAVLKKRKMNPNYIHIYGMNLQETAEKMCATKVALDVQFGTQTGLTMRTIESLAARTKLLTTNKYVTQYDFYHPNNICVIEKENPQIPSDFFTSSYEEIPEDIVSKYSLRNWLRTLFS